jgi:hypothetical protein
MISRMEVFRRPSVLKSRRQDLEFVTRTTANGAFVSSWEVKNTLKTIATGTPGRVGEIVTSMHRPDPPFIPREKKFNPHTRDYEFYARKMFESEAEQKEYIAKCEQYYADLPVKVVPVIEKPVINFEMIADFWRGKKTMPPIEDRVNLLRAAGYPEERVQRYIRYYEKEKEMSDEYQKRIDKIFGNFTVSKPKQKKEVKVIKPVKKKMT